MKGYSSDKIRNIVLLGHGSTGKTTFLEAGLLNTKVISRLGKVESGNTVSDYEKMEIEKGYTINQTLVPVEYNGTKLNFIDTPGFFDFAGEARAALSTGATAIIMVDASSGIQVGTEKAWDLVKEYNSPTFFVINKIDKDNVNVDEVVAALQDKFGTLCHSALELFFKDGNTDALSCDFCATEGENRILLARAHAFAQGFSDSSFYKEHIEGHKTHPEMRFYTYDENNPDIAVEGVIDLLVEGNDYNLVVDYKTDALKNPEVHKHQLMTYVRVAKELTGKESRGVLYYLRDGSLGPVWDKDGKEITI